MLSCYHCGDPCKNNSQTKNDKVFCCHGCLTVFEIFEQNDLSYYYKLDENPGNTPNEQKFLFDFLDNTEILNRLTEFNDNDVQVVSLDIPSIHCSSCIWILENLHKLDKGVRSSQVNFPEKKVRISLDSSATSIKEVCKLLTRIGYKPNITLDDYESKKVKRNNSLLIKLAVAGFAFGNIMFLSFPEYFEESEFWLNRFKPFFRWIIFAFSIPVVFYAASDYFKSAIQSLRSKILSIDIPIALGISVLFLRSTFDIITSSGSGFFDSLAGLVFFLLLGKFFQQRTYSSLSFERDYKSYFPIAVTRLIKEPTSKTFTEEQIPVYDLKVGDRMIIRNEELVTADCILLKGNAFIDYSFVTGESEPKSKNNGEKLFAGGRQKGGVIEVQVVKSVEQSYLTQLWSNKIFDKSIVRTYQGITDKISRHFTISILIISLLASFFWLIVDSSKILNVFTSVLIVACPCALALAAPFTLGNMLRIFGRKDFYLKDVNVIERMSEIDMIVFDKTGTLTSSTHNIPHYVGNDLNQREKDMLTSSLRASNHPLSRSLYEVLKNNNILPLKDFQETAGMGIEVVFEDHSMKIGSSKFVEEQTNELLFCQSSSFNNKTSVHVSSDRNYKGYYYFENQYRIGIQKVIKDLQKHYKVFILSGDNEGERKYLKSMLGKDLKMLFDQKPQDKLNFIKSHQKLGRKVMMIGDGLNDAGALSQSDVGIAISEKTNVFSPACDGILNADKFESIPEFLRLSKTSLRIIKYAFFFSLVYNVIGLGFAISANLSPLVAAILMPLSSISIVVFTTFFTFRAGKKSNE